MSNNKPRAAIHVGYKKSFSTAESNEAERRGWNERTYQLKNAEKEKNNHYDITRKHLNFEITKGGKIVPLGSNPTPLHERLQQRLDELAFKPYKDKDHPDQIADNSPNSTVTILFSGDHDVMQRLAFGSQKVDVSTPNADNSKAYLEQAIYDWARDSYDFACDKWGEENIISFCVHCDETSIHAHVQTVPVEKVKKRGRIGSTYIKNDSPNVRLTTKEWKQLPKEERANYHKEQAEKDYVERVSFAKVWGETRKEQSEYLTNLHTEYHDKVGYKYGLERGIPYNELTEEEKHARKHKDKVTLEAERQAKEAMVKAVQQKEKAEKALDSIKEYAVLATIDKKELTFPLLNISGPIKKAKEVVANELSIPIPTVIGQKSWRESRAANINGAIETLVAAINTERDKENEGVRSSINKMYTYYMQQLNKQIKENQSLRTRNDKLKDENDQVRKRISELDEHAVERVTIAKNAMIDRLSEQLKDLQRRYSELGNDYTAIQTSYDNLVGKWNALWAEPEYNEAAIKVRKRKELEASEMAQHETRRQEEAKQRVSRYNSTISQFIQEGREALHSFALTTRWQFTDKEANSIYYGLIAMAEEKKTSLFSKDSIKATVDAFLSGMDWRGCSELREHDVNSWTNLFATKEVKFEESTIDNFLSFVNLMSGSADAYTTLGGSNGCADQLTNWDGTKKKGWGGTTNQVSLSM